MSKRFRKVELKISSLNFNILKVDLPWNGFVNLNSGFISAVEGLKRRIRKWFPTCRWTLLGLFTRLVTISVLLLLGADALHPGRRGREGQGRQNLKPKPASEMMVLLQDKVRTLTISWAGTEISSQLVGGTWCSSQYWPWTVQNPWKREWIRDEDIFLLLLCFGFNWGARWRSLHWSIVLAYCLNYAPCFFLPCKLTPINDEFCLHCLSLAM